MFVLKSDLIGTWLILLVGGLINILWGGLMGVCNVCIEKRFNGHLIDIY